MYYETDVYQNFYWITGGAILLSVCTLLGFLFFKLKPILSVNDFYNIVSNPEDDENVTQSPKIPILLLYSGRSIQRLAVSHLKEAISNGVPNTRVCNRLKALVNY